MLYVFRPLIEAEGWSELRYYNEARAHLSLAKDAPISRPIERFGRVIAEPMVGGLHHRLVFSRDTIGLARRGFSVEPNSRQA